MSSESFYPLTEKTLEKLYQANLTAAEWRLWTYLAVTDPWGDCYKDLPNTLTVMQKAGIKKSTFYAAIAKFQEFELFDFQDKGFAFRNLQGVPKVRNVVQKSGQHSEISEKCPKPRKLIRKNGTLSKISEHKSSETLHSNNSSPPQTIKTYTDFKKTLSDGERENFLNFVREKTKDFSPQINDIEGWLAKKNEAEQNRWEVYYDLFQKSQPELVQATQNAKWENHPQRDEWLEKIRTMGNFSFRTESGKLDNDRNEFWHWVVDNGLLGEES
ncbi:MAG: hypothetical protein DSM106950_00455 [Stigonema ocellatum SAG 48.90 = DSM 106950]|nr:hypothetical protein [Stigonema ocellatum SAG 48.90 = DSM 106950]